MDLKDAFKAHKNGDHPKALKIYKHFFDKKLSDPVLYQNYGALLRYEARLEDSLAVYQRGIAFFPTEVSLLFNCANLFWEMGRRTSAIEFGLRSLHILVAKYNINGKKALQFDAISSVLIEQLTELKYFALAFELLRFTARLHSFDSKYLLAIRSLYLAYSSSTQNYDISIDLVKLESILEEKILDSTAEEQLKIRFVLANNALASNRIDECISAFSKIETFVHDKEWIESTTERDRIREIWSQHCWNLSCKLLQHQRFELGWKLYDYGLVTKAPGKQLWQRALKKPYSGTSLPIWKGQSLTNKSLLLLEEQAIGDVMMFLTVINSLLEEAGCIHLIINSRLFEIYNRSFSSLISNGKLFLYNTAKPSSFPVPSVLDYQIPLGSIFQHRFKSISQYGFKSNLLIADPKKSDSFAAKYNKTSPNPNKLRIGVSWRGGGHQKRRLEKSIDIAQFSRLLNQLSSRLEMQFVSLQYGNVSKEIDEFLKYKVNIVHDPDVDSMKDMDSWLAQVNTCDAVISVANTTIHGSGGLSIPTMCLLSTKFDWRWLNSPNAMRSYWYPSVGIAPQSEDGSWDHAFGIVTDWVADGCPSPVSLPCS